MRRRTFILLLIFVSTCGLCLFFAARPLYRKAKIWRAETLAKDALDQLDRGDVQRAERSLVAAAKLAGNVPKVSLVAARIASLRKDGTSLPHWVAYIQSGKAEAQEIYKAGEDALRAGNRDAAGLFLKELRVRRPEAEALACRLAANLALAQGDTEAAWSYAARQVRLAPEDNDAKLLLAYVGLRVSDPRRREQSLLGLSALAKGIDATSLDALTIMANEVEPGSVNQTALGARLKAHPLAQAFHRMLGAELQERADPTRAKRLLSTLDFEETPFELRHSAAMWFASRARYEEALLLLPEAIAMTRQDFLLTYLDCLAGIGDWGRIREIVADDRSPLDQALRELFLCRAMEEVSCPAEADAAWTRALASIGTRPALMRYFIYYAERQGWTKRRWQVAEVLMADPRTGKEGFLIAARLAREQRDTRKLRDLLKNASERYPGVDEIENDLAYCDLLLNENVDAALIKAHGLVSAKSRTLAHRITLALGLLRKSKHEAALKLFEGLRIPWDRAMQHHRAVYSAILKANRNSNAAKAVLGNVEATQLLPEEAELAGLQATVR